MNITSALIISLIIICGCNNNTPKAIYYGANDIWSGTATEDATLSLAYSLYHDGRLVVKGNRCFRVDQVDNEIAREIRSKGYKLPHSVPIHLAFIAIDGKTNRTTASMYVSEIQAEYIIIHVGFNNVSTVDANEYNEEFCVPLKYGRHKEIRGRLKLETQWKDLTVRNRGHQPVDPVSEPRMGER